MNCDSINMNKPVSIYRFQFTTEINDAITDFTKIHMYDHRHDYKEAWIIWCKSNENIIKEEITRLQELGYKGDVQDKMYKAGRYYFRKKENTGHENKKQKERNSESSEKEIVRIRNFYTKISILSFW